jgi:hypothetical protein
MKEKVIKKQNLVLHFFKLLAVDIVVIWTIGFCVIFATWMIKGAGAASYLLPNLNAILSVTIIWILASLPFLVRYKTIKSNEVTFDAKLQNYKLILLLNTIFFIVFVLAIIMTPM